jgi:hypothetical protein
MRAKSFTIADLVACLIKVNSWFWGRMSETEASESTCAYLECGSLLAVELNSSNKGITTQPGYNNADSSKAVSS